VPTDAVRWEVPELVFPRPNVSARATDPAYDIVYTESVFGFAVVRRADGEAIFNTTTYVGESASFRPLVFQEQYMEISTHLPSDANIYGLGERVRPLRLDAGLTYTMWSADEATPVNQNVYGVHPYYMELRRGQAHGVVRPGTAAARRPCRGYSSLRFTRREESSFGPRRTAADEQQRHGRGPEQPLADVPSHRRRLRLLLFPGAWPDRGNTKVAGGMLIAMLRAAGVMLPLPAQGPTPAAVNEQYTELIGRPYLPAYWTLGFHQCRWGYDTLDDVRAVVAGYRDADIPLETMWIDIDYMEDYKDWTFDPERYPQGDVKAFIDELHANGQHNVLIVDPAIKNETGCVAPPSP